MKKNSTNTKGMARTCFLNVFATSGRIDCRKCCIHKQRRNKGGTISRAPNQYMGRRKVPTVSQVLSSIQYIASDRPLVRTWGRKSCFLPRATSNLVTPLSISDSLYLMLDLSNKRCFRLSKKDIFLPASGSQRYLPRCTEDML